MGLISLGKNIVGMTGEAINSTFADSILDYYRCEGMGSRVLMVPGTKVMRGKTFNPGSGEVFSDGSVFDVADGQCAVVLENGAIHSMVICRPDAKEDDCAGQYQFRSDRAPSFFGPKGFIENSSAIIKEIGKRITAGGQTMNTHQIIYINLRPVKGMKAGTGGITFRDSEMNITLQIGVHGNFAFIIDDPIKFYKSCIADSFHPFTLDSGEGKLLESNLKTALQSVFKSTFAIISKKQIPYDQIQGNIKEFIDAANIELGESWSQHGIKLDEGDSKFEADADEKSKKLIEDFQRNRAYGSNEAVLRSRIVDGQLEAMNAAAGNSAGATVGLMGMGLMGNMQNVMGTSQMVSPISQQSAVSPVSPPPPAPFPAPTASAPTPTASAPTPTAPAPTPAAQAVVSDSVWICSCGTSNTMKFCGSCGNPKPQPPQNPEWTCSCGTTNTMKFCGNCGSFRPEPVRSCSACGWELPKSGDIPKFCPNCGTAL